MALRLIEIILTEQDGLEVQELLKDYKVLEHRQVKLSDKEVLVRILLDAEQTEAVLDLFEKRYTGKEGKRMVILAVEATLPRVEPEPANTHEQAAPEEKSPKRISREELYEDIKDAAEFSWVYIAMVVLSTIVAAVGLYYDSVAIIIGAMVIAPLLGPNMALSLGTTLGDLPLLRRAIMTALAGIATTMVLSVFIGMLLQVNPASPELASRNGVGLGDIAVALASGCAGALAFTTGVSTALIGVMVAVALLPPLVAFGLLLGGWHPALAMGALSLFLVNLISINLAGVTTFMAQGIHPASWWKKDQAKKATHIALMLWVGMLAVLIVLILLFQKS
ncbi:MAG: TIGR00341 family protein [Methylicorpusculum sp.]|uniref:TIGR00341 family protein n=1 Tax=Methylicorpusculum sp. TaxID=2713644 RepID=UPI002724CFDB|nr:TIGR00341 family protein [Methylicorpusculum sp.]MDO8938321.1 TIGR00341 family protein [Methylicorpusculum sp.]MDP2200601.1 TIGR00341 family protein [Methylicorpusculum sp.]